jgi:HD-GYP domain-containing protein (c-di-GMP phosphodiesterase class II)
MQIPLGARIVGCADALTLCIEKGDSLSEALEYIAMRESGKYDPKVIAAIEKYRSKAEVCLHEIGNRRRAFTTDKEQ